MHQVVAHDAGRLFRINQPRTFCTKVRNDLPNTVIFSGEATALFPVNNIDMYIDLFQPSSGKALFSRPQR